MFNGVDAVSPEVNFVNNQIPLTILNLPQNSYDVDGINGFVNYFNTPPTPYNYTATSLGPFSTLPEIRSKSLTTIPNQTAVPIAILKVYYSTTPTITGSSIAIGQFIPAGAGDFTGNSIAAGLAVSANVLPAWNGGLASSLNNVLTLEAPLNTFGSFNNKFTLIQQVVYTRAFGTITIISGSNGLTIGKLQLAISGSVPVTFPLYQAIGANTAAWWALAYVGVINGGTGIHGYTAAVTGPGGDRIRITAPLYSGSSANGRQILTIQTADGVKTQATIPILSGGSETPTNQSIISTSIFAGGGLTVYDKVRFTADPAEQTWIYNGEDFIYNNVTDSYTDSDPFTGGIDTTIGQLYLGLSAPAVPFFPGTPPYTLYSDSSPVNYSSFQEWVTAINNNPNNLGFSTSNILTDFRINSPQNSFAYFNNGNEFELYYTYDSPQYAGDNYGQSIPIENGVDPTLTPYEGQFVAGVLGDFINTDPCAPSIVTQTCLSNAQVSKIITHINKLTK